MVLEAIYKHFYTHRTHANTPETHTTIHKAFSNGTQLSVYTVPFSFFHTEHFFPACSLQSAEVKIQGKLGGQGTRSGIVNQK